MNVRIIGRAFRDAALLLVLGAASAAGQTGTPAQAGAPLTLGDVYRAAAAADPRVRQLELEAEQAALRLRAIDAARLPAFGVDGRAQHQSEVASFPLRDPAGAPLITPPKSTFDLYVAVEQRIVDPTLAAKAALVRAELDEARARIATSLFALRQEVDEAFFAAESAAARARAIEVRMAALAQLKGVADARVREGAALPSEARAIEATLLQRRQDLLQMHLRRRAALDRLARLTGDAVTRDTTLVTPQALTGAPATTFGVEAAAARSRPEYEQFEKTRARIAQQASAIGVEARPRLTAFARVGVGRPGLNFIADDVNPYWVGGLQLRWTPWSWGAHAREREALALERDIVATEAEAFTARIERSLDGDLAEVERLAGVLALDAQIVALREQIEREARIRWEARVIPLAEYLERSGELLDAEVAREEHRIALAAARARVLTTAGLEVK